MKVGEKVRHDVGCPFCKGIDGTVKDEGFDAIRVDCEGCGAYGPREWGNGPIKQWKSDNRNPSPMWCVECEDIIGDATFVGETPITIKLRPHADCDHGGPSCCHDAGYRYRPATEEQLKLAREVEVRRNRRLDPCMGTIRKKHAYFTSLEYNITFRVELPVPKGKDAWWFEEDPGGGGCGTSRGYDERNATEEEIDAFLKKERKIRGEERKRDSEWSDLLALAGLKLSNFSRIRAVGRRNGKIYVTTRDYGKARIEQCGTLLKSCPDEDPTYWHYTFRVKEEASERT